MNNCFRSCQEEKDLEDPPRCATSGRETDKGEGRGKKGGARARGKEGKEREPTSQSFIH
jgi:hypothetical protein